MPASADARDRHPECGSGGAPHGHHPYTRGSAATQRQVGSPLLGMHHFLPQARARRVFRTGGPMEEMNAASNIRTNQLRVRMTRKYQRCYQQVRAGEDYQRCYQEVVEENNLEENAN